MDRVIVRFERPSGTGRKLPIEATNQAMVSLADTDEMRPLLCEASNEGKALAIDIYQSRAGCLIFVHFSKGTL
jgi:hypothetical protein